MAAVMLLSLVPAAAPLPATGWDKSNYFLAFMLLGWLGMCAFSGRTAPVLVGLLAHCGLIEVLQSLTPSRVAQWCDLLADGLSLLLGTGLVALPALFKRIGPLGAAAARHRKMQRLIN